VLRRRAEGRDEASDGKPEPEPVAAGAAPAAEPAAPAPSAGQRQQPRRKGR